MGEKDGGMFAVCLFGGAYCCEDVFSPNEVTIRNAKTINNHKLRNYTLALVNSDAEQINWLGSGLDRFAISLRMRILYILTHRIHC